MVYTEYFVRGTQPTESCDLHQPRSLFGHVAAIFADSPTPEPPPVAAVLPPSPVPAARQAAEATAPPPAAEPEAQPKKRGFWSRVFGRRSKDDDPDRERDQRRDGAR